MMSRLFVRKRNLQQRRLRLCTPIDGHADGKRAPASESHRNIDSRESRSWRVELAVITRGTVEVTDEPRRIAPRRINECIELQLIHRLQDRLAHLVAISRVSLAGGRFRAVRWSRLSGFQAALHRWMKAPGFNNLGEALYGNLVGSRRQ